MLQRNALVRSEEADKIEELKTENFNLKRQLGTIRTENHMLKVKVRKLQEDLTKRQKQIYNLVDPKKSSNFRKFISEHGASMFLNLKEQKEQLLKVLSEKDNQIKKLQNELQITKTYVGNDKKKWFDLENKVSKLQQSAEVNGKNDEYFIKSETDKNLKSTSLNDLKEKNYIFSSLSTVDMESLRPKSSEYAVKDIKHSTIPADGDGDDFEQLNYNLQKIKINTQAKLNSKEFNPTNGCSSTRSNSHNSSPQRRCNSPASPLLTRDTSPSRIAQAIPVLLRQVNSRKMHLSPHRRKNDSPQSDIDRIELQCDTPHEEIQQLQTYFLDMLDEVDGLKSTIIKLQNDQLKTTTVLKDKEDYIDELAEEIQSLKTNTSVRLNKSFVGQAYAKASQSSNKKTKSKLKSKKTDYERKSTGMISTSTSKISIFRQKPENFAKIEEYILTKRGTTVLDDSNVDTVISKLPKHDSETQTEESRRIYRRSRDVHSVDTKQSEDNSQLLFVETYPNLMMHEGLRGYILP